MGEGRRPADTVPRPDAHEVCRLALQRLYQRPPSPNQWSSRHGLRHQHGSGRCGGILGRVGLLVHDHRLAGGLPGAEHGVLAVLQLANQHGRAHRIGEIPLHLNQARPHLDGELRRRPRPLRGEDLEWKRRVSREARVVLGPEAHKVLRLGQKPVDDAQRRPRHPAGPAAFGDLRRLHAEEATLVVRAVAQDAVDLHGAAPHRRALGVLNLHRYGRRVGLASDARQPSRRGRQVRGAARELRGERLRPPDVVPSAGPHPVRRGPRQAPEAAPPATAAPLGGRLGLHGRQRSLRHPAGHEAVGSALRKALLHRCTVGISKGPLDLDAIRPSTRTDQGGSVRRRPVRGTEDKRVGKRGLLLESAAGQQPKRVVLLRLKPRHAGKASHLARRTKLRRAAPTGSWALVRWELVPCSVGDCDPRGVQRADLQALDAAGHRLRGDLGVLADGLQAELEGHIVRAARRTA
mmetsp:Transcript_100320/g.318502  ORF Transcript_100320/g.318502 Transcript_100320/m.318502 type:complete len:463 (-) Transcript_100320:151-1539(-)